MATPPPAPETIARVVTPIYDPCPLPYPKIIPSKSNNVMSIREALRALHNPLLSPEEVQEQLERDCATVSVMRQRAEHVAYLKRTGGISRESDVNDIIMKWTTKFTAAINRLRGHQAESLDHEQVKEEGQQLEQTELTTSLFLTLMEPLEAETIAYATVRQLMRVNDYNPVVDGYPVASLARSIGQALQNEVFAVQIDDETFKKMTSLR